MPMRSAIIAVFTNVVLNLTLIWLMGTGGFAASTAVCSYLQLCILVTALRRRLGGGVLEGLASATVKTIIATACMYVVALITLSISKNLADRFKLLLTVPLAAVSLFINIQTPANRDAVFAYRTSAAKNADNDNPPINHGVL